MILPETVKQILLQSGFVTETDYLAAEKTAEEIHKPVTDILVFRGVISEDAVGKIIAEHFAVPFIRLRDKTISLDVLKLIPEQAALSFHLIPFSNENGVLSVGMESPDDLEAIEFIKRKTGLQVKQYYISSNDFARSIGQYKKNIKNIFQNILDENASQANTDADEATGAEDVPVVRILDTILEFASAEGASDVHLNVLEDMVMVRFRIDGMLQDIAKLPKGVHSALIARIKILSSLKIDEHRVPQDGRFKFKIYEDFIALRVSILPAFFGENVVMRLLPESSRPLSLEELGVGGEDLPKIMHNLKKPHGMILVTGPTGSGKTTTLYSMLNILNRPEVNLCTIEDPIEYSLRRIIQTQVNQQAGYTFAGGLRSLLRQDPDVIMIGEIRDNETAEIAIHSALTGHLVLSTLHTNSAAGAIPRFLDMGAQGFLLASTINLIIAQRLVRKICTNCITKIEPSEEMLQFVKRYSPHNPVADFFMGKGCDECNHTGYKGRVSVFEVLEVTPEIRAMIVGNVTDDLIEQKAHELGMGSLITDGLNKISAGITTIDEIVRVTNN